MERDFGVAGRLLGLGVLDNLLPLIWETQPERFPLTGTILDLADGLIVHSRYVERGVREAGYGGPLWRIPHPAWPEDGPEPAELHGDPLVGCFGHLNMNKRIPLLLEGFCLLRERRPGARLLLVGEATERFDLDRRLERLGLGDEVLIREGYVSEERFCSLMAACDVLVNLRSPTMGETSGSVIRALSLGKPMLVSDLGWFSELPDDVALKIPVDGYEAPTIAGALELASDHAERARDGRPRLRASASTTSAASPTRTSRLSRRPRAAMRSPTRSSRRLAEAAAGIGIHDPAELARIAREAGLV